MRTTRWGILGTGAVAGYFAEGLRFAPGAVLQAVGSRSAENAERFAQQFGAARAHASYDALVRDPEVDVVYVATPNTLHQQHALLALEHGKPVLCEKPFTTSAAQAREVVACARRKKLFCMEAMWNRFLPLVREIVPRVRRGEIGDVKMVVASLGFPYRFDPAQRYFDASLGGGALLDLGVYPVSLVFHLLGRPTSVKGAAVVGASGVDEQATMLLEFEAGRQAMVTTSFRSQLSNDAAIHGTEGILRVHEPLYCPERATITRTPAHAYGAPSKRLQRLRGLVQRTPLRDAYASLKRARTRTAIVRRRLGNGYPHEAIEVMRCLAEGALESPLMPLDESIAVLEAIDELRR